MQCKFSTGGKNGPLPGGKASTPDDPRYPSTATLECDHGHYLVLPQSLHSAAVECKKTGIFDMSGIRCSQCAKVGGGNRCPADKIRCSSDGKYSHQSASFCESASDCDEGFGADVYCSCASTIVHAFVLQATSEQSFSSCVVSQRLNVTSKA